MIAENVDKREILEKLKKYGITEIPFLLIKSGAEKIRAFSGDINKEQIEKIRNAVYVETIGIYFAKIDGEDIRLSLDALHLLKSQLKHNIIELDDKQTEEYLQGKEPSLKEDKEKIYYILKHKEDILGMAKIVNKQIKNYLPKERRRKC
jgi:NOL1/NOP2/fmu family ribosome biogenesis protein